MSRIQIDLDSEQADALLGAIKASKDAPLKGVKSALQAQIKQKDFAAANADDRDKNTELVDNMTQGFVDTLLVAKKKGVSPQVASYFSSVSRLYWNATLAVEKAEKQARKSLPKSIRDTNLSLDAAAFETVMKPYQRKLDNLTKKFLATAKLDPKETGAHQPIEVNDEYTHPLQRKTIAKKVFNSALAAGGIGGHWDGKLGQLAASMDAMVELTKLSTSILKGGATQIDNAFSSMSNEAYEVLEEDYSTRDQIDRIALNVEKAKGPRRK